MPNIVERWLVRRSSQQPRSIFGTDATTGLLRELVPVCSACQGQMVQHAYRFIASHPSRPSTATTDFLEAIRRQDWATVFAASTPAIDQPIFVLYAISCPAGAGMIALLEAQPGPLVSDSEGALVKQAITQSSASMAALRSLCPSCRWIPLSTSCF
jgi:hypothetical protein